MDSIPDVLSVLLRGMMFVALLQAGGAALFLAILGHQLDGSRLAILRLLRVSVPAAAVLVSVQYLLEPARMAGSLAGVFDAELQGYALHTRAAWVMGVRLLALASLAVALRQSGAGMRSFGIAGAVLIAVSFPLIGHSVENAARGWLMPLLAVHLFVAQFWFGALLPLTMVIERESGAVAAPIVARFSRIAAGLVPLILVAGVVVAAELLPAVSALRDPYGIGLVAKTAIFVLLMGLAALNKWQLAPALATGESERVWLRRSIKTEFAIIVVVLMGTATLTTFWSPTS